MLVLQGVVTFKIDLGGGGRRFVGVYGIFDFDKWYNIGLGY